MILSGARRDGWRVSQHLFPEIHNRFEAIISMHSDAGRGGGNLKTAPADEGRDEAREVARQVFNQDRHGARFSAGIHQN